MIPASKAVIEKRAPDAPAEVADAASIHQPGALGQHRDAGPEQLTGQVEVLRRQFERLDGQVTPLARDYETLAATLRELLR